MLSVVYSECHVLIFLLSVVLQNVAMLGVVAQVFKDIFLCKNVDNFLKLDQGLIHSNVPMKFLNDFPVWYLQVLHSRVGSGLTRKNETRLKRLARDKHSSLLRKSVNYGQKGFITLAADTIASTLVMSYLQPWPLLGSS
jgi:hypothetical protein